MLHEIISREQLRDLTLSLAHQIGRLYKPHIWIVMEGGFMFGADLARTIRNLDGVDFLYVSRGYSSKEGPHDPHIYFVGPPQEFTPIHKHVFVDVICEEGLTFELLLSLVPADIRSSIVTCALIQKGEYKPRLVGMKTDSKYLLTGYGMGPYRHLSYVAERRNK